MPAWQVVAILAAGLWAGLINTVVGSGTLVTFPALVALGYPPVTATTSNAIGLTAGTIAGAVGYRSELDGNERRVAGYAVASALGAVVGTALLLTLSPDAFSTIVPALVAVAVVLIAVQALVSRRLADRVGSGRAPSHVVLPLVFLIGVYGGYFTAAQGIMLLGVMGLLAVDSLQRLNAIKNWLVAVVNVVAGTVYAFVAPVSWPVVGLLAVSSACGGWLGARVGRRLPPLLLRAAVVVIGIVAIVVLVVQ